MGYVGVAPGTTTLRLPDGTVIQLADWIDDKMYGSVQLENGDTQQIECFSNGRSQPIPGGARPQTRVDTNIPRNGDSGLPQSYEMLVYGLAIEITRVMRPQAGAVEPVLADGAGALSDPVILRTYFNVDRALYFDFQYNGKSYSTGTIKRYPAGRGFSLFTTNPAIELANNGIPSPRDRVSMVLPIHLRESLGYKGLFQPEAALVINQGASDGGIAMTFVDVVTDMTGLIRRPVV